MESDINLKQFKEQVLGDYRAAFLGREMRRSASMEADCHFVTSRCDVAQVALARFVAESDSYVSAGLDLSAQVVRGEISVADFFKSIFSSAYDLYSHGSPSRLSVAVGMALADASGVGSECDSSARRVIVCSACGDFGSNGDFLEAVCYAAARSLPLCVVLWNNSGSTSNGNLIRQLSGFGVAAGGRKTLNIEAAKGGDYAALCRVMRQQVEAARNGSTSLTFVSGDDSDVEAFGSWLVDKQIASAEQLAEIESEARLEVERQRRGAYLTSLVADTPIRHPHRSLMDIDDACAESALPVMRMPADYGSINKAIGVGLSGALPVVEASAAEVMASSIASYPSVPVIVRSTDIETGSFLASSASSAEVFTPVSPAEALAVYSSLFAKPRQAVVLEPGFDARQSVGGVVVESAEPVAKLSVGEDVTLVSFGLGTRYAADAVRMLESQKLRVDLLHLGSLRPLDPSGVIAASLRKTKRLAIVDTDPSGLSARFVLSSLAATAEPLRHIMSEPVVIKPVSSLRPVEPHDICLAVVNLVN